jgi:hypothetical protein
VKCSNAYDDEKIPQNYFVPVLGYDSTKYNMSMIISHLDTS